MKIALNSAGGLPVRRLVIVAVLSLYAASLLRDIDGPWVGFHDWNGAFYSYLARNLLRYPVGVTRLLPVVHMGPIAPTAAAAIRYANHPPGIEWLLAGSFSIFGVHEWAARLAPIIASLVSLWLLMRIAHAAGGFAVAALAGLFYAVMPMTTYFGRMVDQEPLCLLCMLMAVWGWYASLGEIATSASVRTCRSVWLIGLAGGILIDWVGVLFAGAMLVAVVWRAMRREVPFSRIVVAGAVPFVTLAGVLLLLVYGGMDGSWQSMWDMFVTRSSTAAASQPLRDIASRGGPWQMTFDNLSGGILTLAIAGLPIVFLRSRSRSLLGMLTGVGVAWILMFWPQFLRHNYWMYYLAPVVCVAASAACVELHRLGSRGNARAANYFAMIFLTVTLGWALIGTNELFSRRSFSPELVAAWKSISGSLRPNQPVVLVESPYHTDRRGVYSFRNIVPPHMVYYLDQPLEVARPLSPEQFAGKGAIVVVPLANRAAAEAMRGLDRRYPHYINGVLLVVDLEPGLGRRFEERVR